MHILLPGGGCMPALSPLSPTAAVPARWWQDPIFNKARWCTSGIVQQVQQINNQVTCTAYTNVCACKFGTACGTLRQFSCKWWGAGEHQQQQHRERLQFRDDQQVRLSATCCSVADLSCAVGPSGL